MSELLDLVREQIVLREERLANLEEQLENLREMERLAGSLNGDVPEEPKRVPKRVQKDPPARVLPPPRRLVVPSADVRKPTARKGVTGEQVLAFVHLRGQVTAKDVREEFGISENGSHHHLGSLLMAKAIEKAGKRGRATLYRPKGSVPSATEKRRQEPTLEGRVASAIQLPRSAEEVASRLDADLDDVKAVLRRFLTMGEAEQLSDTHPARYRMCK